MSVPESQNLVREKVISPGLSSLQSLYSAEILFSLSFSVDSHSQALLSYCHTVDQPTHGQRSVCAELSTGALALLPCMLVSSPSLVGMPMGSFPLFPSSFVHLPPAPSLVSPMTAEYHTGLQIWR